MPTAPDILTDPDVELARRHGGRLAAGPWTLRLPRSFGFCGGVLNALNLLQKTLEETQVQRFSGSTVQRLEEPPDDAGGTAARRPRILLLGDIIHNDTVNDEFRRRGVVILSDAEAANPEMHLRDGDTVVIPAFGVERGLAVRLQALHDGGRIRLLDTTCRYVRRIWEFVGREAAAGATVLIMGKPDHPENRATLSRALTDANAVVQLADLAAVAEFAAGIETRDLKLENASGITLHNAARFNPASLAFAAQTTLLHSETMAAEERLRGAAAATGARFVSAAAVCLATQERQKAALELCAEGCTLFLVVGGFASSNTAQLYRLAAQHAPAYFIRTAADFDAARITHYDPAAKAVRTTEGWLPRGPAVIGLLSGASCPAGDVGGVIRKLRQFAERA